MATNQEPVYENVDENGNPIPETLDQIISYLNDFGQTLQDNPAVHPEALVNSSVKLYKPGVAEGDAAVLFQIRGLSIPSTFEAVEKFMILAHAHGWQGIPVYMKQPETPRTAAKPAQAATPRSAPENRAPVQAQAPAGNRAPAPTGQVSSPRETKAKEGDYDFNIVGVKKIYSTRGTCWYVVAIDEQGQTHYTKAEYVPYDISAWQKDQVYNPIEGMLVGRQSGKNFSFVG